MNPDCLNSLSGHANPNPRSMGLWTNWASPQVCQEPKPQKSPTRLFGAARIRRAKSPGQSDEVITLLGPPVGRLE